MCKCNCLLDVVVVVVIVESEYDLLPLYIYMYKVMRKKEREAHWNVAMLHAVNAAFGSVAQQFDPFEQLCTAACSQPRWLLFISSVITAKSYLLMWPLPSDHLLAMLCVCVSGRLTYITYIYI